MVKTADAFRTISEVADELNLPQHVLRFWETRFSQIKPLKRGGGRRYYRPEDVNLLRGIRHLLYGEGYTIKGVQRIFKDQGVRYVSTIWQEGSDSEEVAEGAIEASDNHNVQQPKQEVTSQIALEQQDSPNATVPLQEEPAEAIATLQASHGLEVNNPASTAEAQPSLPIDPPGQMDNTSVDLTQPTVEIEKSVAPTPMATNPQPLNQGVTAPTVVEAKQPPITPPMAENAAPELRPSRISVGGKTETVPLKTPPYMVQPAVPAHLVQAIRSEQLTPDRVTGLPIQPVYEEEASTALPTDILPEEDPLPAAPIKQKGFLSRLAQSVIEEPSQNRVKVSIREDQAEQLQSTLFELLECKRLLDQIR